jgi:hypothetical protein
LTVKLTIPVAADERSARVGAIPFHPRLVFTILIGRDARVKPAVGVWPKRADPQTI